MKMRICCGSLPQWGYEHRKWVVTVAALPVWCVACGGSQSMKICSWFCSCVGCRGLGRLTLADELLFIEGRWSAALALPAKNLSNSSLVTPSLSSMSGISADNHFSMSSMAELRGAGAWQDTKHHKCSSQDLTFVNYWSPVCDADPLEMIVKSFRSSVSTCKSHRSHRQRPTNHHLTA